MSFSPENKMENTSAQRVIFLIDCFVSTMKKMLENMERQPDKRKALFPALDSAQSELTTKPLMAFILAITNEFREKAAEKSIILNMIMPVITSMLDRAILKLTESPQASTPE